MILKPVVVFKSTQLETLGASSEANIRAVPSRVNSTSRSALAVCQISLAVTLCSPCGDENMGPLAANLDEVILPVVLVTAKTGTMKGVLVDLDLNWVRALVMSAPPFSTLRRSIILGDIVPFLWKTESLSTEIVMLTCK